MKKDIQPKVYKATITCACGNSEQVLTTKGEQVHVEVCLPSLLHWQAALP